MSLSQIESVRKEFDEKIRALRNEVQTLANGGAVAIREVTPVYGASLERPERYNVVERRVLDPDQVLVPKAQFHELERKLDALGDVAKLVGLAYVARDRAEKADRLALQTFNSLANICDALGLHVKLENGALVVTGAADNAPEVLAFHLEVLRLREERKHPAVKL